MNKVVIKPRLLFNILGIALLIGFSTVAWSHDSMRHARLKALLSSVVEGSDTTLITQERSRITILFEVLKKVGFIDWALPPTSAKEIVQCVEQWKFSFTSTYRQNVFYLYASTTVP